MRGYPMPMAEVGYATVQMVKPIDLPEPKVGEAGRESRPCRSLYRNRNKIIEEGNP